jgi:hypothetical protein
MIVRVLRTSASPLVILNLLERADAALAAGDHVSDGGIVRPIFHQIAPTRVSPQVRQQLTQPFNLRYQEGNPTAPVDVVRIVLQPLEITRTDRLARSVQHRQNNLDT